VLRKRAFCWALIRIPFASCPCPAAAPPLAILEVSSVDFRVSSVDSTGNRQLGVVVRLRNAANSLDTAYGVTGTLMVQTPGVQCIQPTRSYGTLAVGDEKPALSLTLAVPAAVTTVELGLNISFADASGNTMRLVEPIPVTLNLPPPNHAPVLDPIENQFVKEGQKLLFTVSGHDDDGDALIFSATQLPQGSSFEPLQRSFQWTPGSGQAGAYYVQFEASDSKATAAQTVLVTVLPSSTSGYARFSSISVVNGQVQLSIVGDGVSQLRVEFSPDLTNWGRAYTISNFSGTASVTLPKEQTGLATGFLRVIAE
jgi:hypothetical protein